MNASPDISLLPDPRGIRHLEFKAMGTHCAVKFRLADDAGARVFALAVLGWVGGFEARYSRFRGDSIVSRINRDAGGGWVELDAEAEHLLDLAGDLHQRTNGVIDAAMLPLIQIWDWKSVHRRLPDQSEIRRALDLSGWHKVERKPGAVRLPLAGMGLDFGGFGKEYAVDIVARMAGEHGISDALIDFGRDIFALGGNGAHPFWHVGIEDGNAPGSCWGGLAVSGRAVCSSGDYNRHFIHDGTRYGHILDPRSGRPVTNLMRAVTVVAPSCLEAGAYSTAVFVLGAREGLHLASLARGVEVCAQSATGIEGTRGFSRWLVKAA